MSDQTGSIPAFDISRLIRSVRDQRVILDNDLAQLYEVPTKRLNEQLRRNLDRFPEDFAFQLTDEEWTALRSQIATLKLGRGGHRKYLPHALTEHGALMAANILNSPPAGSLSPYVIPAFLKNREDLAAVASELKKPPRIGKI